MVPSGTVYGGFIFSHAAVVDWGRRLGGVVGEDMKEHMRKTARHTKINSFSAAHYKIRSQLSLHGIPRLVSVSPFDSLCVSNYEVAVKLIRIPY